MEKPSENLHPIHDLIKRRWSPRAFSEKPVEKKKLLSLLEAARWAASSFNEQPWRFILATKEDKAEYDKLFSVMVEGNQAWAIQAPVLMLTVAKLQFALNQKPNRHAFHDVGLAMGNFSLQATEMGLFVHQMAGFSVEKARELFAIPADAEPVAMVAIGYPGAANTLPEKLREKEKEPRRRKPLKDLVYFGIWEGDYRF
jgi:nitroreductase